MIPDNDKDAPVLPMRRTQHLLDLIRLHRPRTITEVGVAKGQTAISMIVNAARYQPEIEYHGFDLFAEGFDDDTRKREFQGKQPHSYDQVCEALDKVASMLRGFNVVLRWHLHRGPTSQTLLDSNARSALAADLVYLDGGHSVETIEQDLRALLGKAKTIVLDDFYHDRPLEFLARWGCNTVVQKVVPKDFAFLPIIETVPGADGASIAVGQVVVPRRAWPWARLQAPLAVMRARKPARTFVQADAVSERFLKQAAEAWGGSIGGELPADFAYIDCAFREADGTHIFASAEEARAAWSGVEAPVKCFGGFIQGDTTRGAGAAIPEGALIVSGLDVIDGTEVGAFVWPKEAWPIKAQIHVATRNCVDDGVILANVKANFPRLPRYIEPCLPHAGRVTFVSAGPTLAGELETIREEQQAGAYVVCVKHAHDALIEAGIVPWACVLLDPRDHVKQFIQEPHPGTIYFVASMVAPSTLDILLAKQARIVGYHALVGAGEDKLLPKGTRFLVGGTSAATRGLPLLLMLGFRDFVLRAYDSCFLEKPSNVGEKTKLGYDRFVKVEIGGKKFWTELELIAQAQDFKQFMETLNQAEMLSNVHLEVPGTGIIPHLWALMRPVRPAFADVAAAW